MNLSVRGASRGLDSHEGFRAGIIPEIPPNSYSLIVEMILLLEKFRMISCMFSLKCVVVEVRIFSRFSYQKLDIRRCDMGISRIRNRQNLVTAFPQTTLRPIFFFNIQPQSRRTTDDDGETGKTKAQSPGTGASAGYRE